MQNRAYPGRYSEQDLLTGRVGLLLHKIVGEIVISIWNIKNLSVVAERLADRRESIERVIDVYVSDLAIIRKISPEVYRKDISHINKLLSEYNSYVNGDTYFYSLEEIG